MANIRLDLDYPLEDGQSLTFKAPCDCTAITGIKVYYPVVTESASTNTSKVLTLKDAHGNTLTGIGNLFSEGAYVKVVVDTTNNFAYIQNADTNKYLENKFSNIDVSTPINNHNTDASAHSDIRTLIDGKAASSHNHAASNITSGTLAADRLPTVPLTKGGTGKTTAPLGLYALINGSTTLAATGLATGDYVGIGDVSATTGKKVTLANLATYLSGQMGGGKVAFGSYQGTGTHGPDNPNSITFDFAPKMVIIFGEMRLDQYQYPLLHSDYGSFAIMADLTTSYVSKKGLSSVGNVCDNYQQSYAKKSSDGKTIYWYHYNSESLQNNASNYEYYYMAIG